MPDADIQRVARHAQALGFVLAVRTAYEDDSLPLPGIMVESMDNQIAYSSQLLEEFGIDLKALPHPPNKPRRDKLGRFMSRRR